MTGFRVARDGAQGHYQVKPDLTALGKVIGGGMPVGAFGGRQDIMEQLAPQGPVYQAGTLSGNPVAMAAGLKTLELISAPGFYEPVIEATENLVNGLQKLADAAGIPFSTNHAGSMFGVFFTEEKASPAMIKLWRATPSDSISFFMFCLTTAYTLRRLAMRQGLFRLAILATLSIKHYRLPKTAFNTIS